MTNQVVSRFRYKRLHYRHPLPIYRESQLPDIQDTVSLQRSVPHIETGVEKDEEEEVLVYVLVSDWSTCFLLWALFLGISRQREASDYRAHCILTCSIEMIFL